MPATQVFDGVRKELKSPGPDAGPDTMRWTDATTKVAVVAAVLALVGTGVLPVVTTASADDHDRQAQDRSPAPAEDRILTEEDCTLEKLIELVGPTGTQTEVRILIDLCPIEELLTCDADEDCKCLLSYLWEELEELPSEVRERLEETTERVRSTSDATRDTVQQDARSTVDRVEDRVGEPVGTASAEAASTTALR